MSDWPDENRTATTSKPNCAASRRGVSALPVKWSSEIHYHWSTDKVKGLGTCPNNGLQ